MHQLSTSTRGRNMTFPWVPKIIYVKRSHSVARMIALDDVKIETQASRAEL